ncbi:MAG: SH3 domain-containing protein [Sphingobacteriales bacterium]
MKILTALIFFTGVYFLANAQSFAIINDKDGFVNIRKDKSINSPVIGKLNNDDIFQYDPDEKSDWIKIYAQHLGNEDGHYIEGYIHKSRVFPLSNLKSVKNIRSFKDSCVAIDDGLMVIIKSKLFNPKKHKLTYYPSNSNILTKIDGLHIWGTDGGMPKQKISEIKIIKNGKSIVIPEDAFNNLYEPNLSTLQIYIGKANTIYIEMDNSDGAGGYSIIWIIKNDKFYKKHIDNLDA